MTNNIEDVRNALARTIANRDVPDELVNTVAKQLADVKHKIRRIDICEIGFCCDFFIDSNRLAEVIPDLINVDFAQIRELKIFPYGIFDPDFFHLQVTQQLDALPPNLLND